MDSRLIFRRKSVWFFEGGGLRIKGAFKAEMGVVKVDLRSEEIFVDKRV